MHIIVKGSPFVKGNKISSENWSKDKDRLHYRRKELEGDLKQTIFSKDKMWCMDCQSDKEENKRAEDYITWKETKDKIGQTNEQKMAEWAGINRKFKEHNEESKPHDADELRKKENVKYN